MSTTELPLYDPEVYNPSLTSLLDQAKDDWGDPQKNRENLVPYGIGPLDKALYGMDVEHGEFILVQGREKRRKSTFISNVVINYMKPGGLPVTKPRTNIDILESSVPPKKYRDQLIANVASRFLIEQGHRPNGPCPVCSSPICRELMLSAKFLKYNTRTPPQKGAIEYAFDTMRMWSENMFIHGANYRMGDTRSLKRAVERFEYFIDEFGIKIFIVDHVQQYMWADDPSDYEKQIRAVGVLSDVVARHSVVMIVVSQVSLTSWRESRKQGTVLTAAGGAKGAQESSTVLTTEYQSGGGYMTIKIEEAREAADISVNQNIEDSSGAFYGNAYYSSQQPEQEEEQDSYDKFSI